MVFKINSSCNILVCLYSFQPEIFLLVNSYRYVLWSQFIRMNVGTGLLP